MAIITAIAPTPAATPPSKGRLTIAGPPTTTTETKTTVSAPVQRVTFTDLQINLSIQASIHSVASSTPQTVSIGLTVDKKSNLVRAHIVSPAAQNANFVSDLETHLTEILMSLALAAYNGTRESSVLTNFSSGV